jgi:hypothetical protein
MIAAALGLALAVAAAWALFGPGGSPPRPAPAAAAPPAAPVIPPSDPSASPSPVQSSSPAPSASPTPGPSPTPAASRAGTGQPAGPNRTFYVTFYGARDNTPSGSRDIAYPSVHSQAGGTGAYQDPITFATDRDELRPGTVIYYPYVKRYFVMEDDCTECDADWTGHGPNGGPRFPHLDLWAGSSVSPGIVDCEDSLTRNGQVSVVVDPPATLPVSAGPLYDDKRCFRP